MDNNKSERNTKDRYDLGAFNFLQAGWWILHLIAIVGIFYLGSFYAGKIF